MTLPAGWTMVRFHGEQMSADPDAVEEQNLAPNDAMLYHMVLRDCGADLGEPFAFAVDWVEPRTGAAVTDAASFIVEQMLDQADTQIDKAVAVIAWAEALGVPAGERRDAADAAYDVARAAYEARPADTELAEVLDLISTWRSRL